jgi:hypothetical protein
MVKMFTIQNSCANRGSDQTAAKPLEFPSNPKSTAVGQIDENKDIRIRWSEGCTNNVAAQQLNTFVTLPSPSSEGSPYISFDGRRSEIHGIFEFVNRCASESISPSLVNTASKR